MLNYTVIKSGSSGNCVLIDDVMVDCGVAYNIIEEYLYDVEYLLITHIHSDHLKPSTLAKIKKKFPNIEVISNYDVYQSFGVDTIINLKNPVETDDYDFYAFECDHDVITYGYYWESESGERIFYATDTNNLDGVPDGLEFDYFFIESNHDKFKLEATRYQSFKGCYHPYYSGIRHLSTQKAKEFYLLRRATREAELIELHKSSRFY